MTRKLWETVASLYGVHAVNYVVPLFTLPYLARTLGPSEWGAFAFADAYSRVISVVVEYGFGLSATREVADVRHDPRARGRCLSSVLCAQALLCVGALGVTFLLASFFSVFETQRPLLPAALFLAVSQGMNPMWYFQALENVRAMGALWVGGRIVGAIGLFVFVHASADAGRALLIQGTAPLLSVIVGLFLAYRDTPWMLPSMGEAWASLRSGASIFMFRAGVSVYTTVNVLILGLLAPPVVVGWFAGAEKMAKAAAMGTAPIAQAFYPRISHLLAHDRAGAANVARTSARLMLGVGIAIGLILMLSAPLLVKLLLGPGFEHSVNVLRIMALLPPLVAATNAFGVQWMLTLRLDREMNWIIAGAGVFNLAVSFLVGRALQEIGMAVSLVLAELFIVLAILVVLRRRGLNPWVKDAVEVEATP